MSNPRADDLFLSLTPERVLHAVEAGGHAVTGLCYPLNSFENRVYEVELADRSRVIAKFYRPGRWSEEQILAEHRFLEDLAADEIPVVPMRRFADGSTLARIEEIWYSLADRRGGRAPAELNDELALRLGRLVGRLHNVGARKPAAPRLKMTADAFIDAYNIGVVTNACYPSLSTETTIDGHPASLAFGGCNEHFYFARAITVIGNRIWIFDLDGPDRSLIVPFLSTVKIDATKVID